MTVSVKATSVSGVTEAKVLGAILSGVGVLHFASPKMFDDSIPVELPGNPRVYTYLSGVAGMAAWPGCGPAIEGRRATSAVIRFEHFLFK